MISYKYTKKLKKAGFPKDWTEWENHDQELLKATWDMYGKGYSPTLSELIEACGERFETLEKTKNNWKCIPAGSCLYSLDWTVGSSPEEAVAKLWLKLNK